MLKQLEHTDKLKAMIAKAHGGDDGQVDTSKLAVFEAVAANTRPLKRTSGLFAKAVPDVSMLQGMHSLMKKGEHVPLQSMHYPGIPKGKVFATSLQKDDASSNTSLHSLFYLPPSEGELIDKLNTGVIGEVSIGALAKNLLCSECGWDYNGDDCTIDNVWDCTCANDHKIGQKGVHLKLHGVQKWNELSLVDKGAVDGASVLARPRQRMGSPERLQARGFDDSLFFLFASADLTPIPKETPAMTVDVEKYVALSNEVAVLKHTSTEITTKLTAAESQVTELRAAVAAKDTEIATLKAGDAATLKAERDLLDGFLSERLTAALALTGKAGQALPETVSARVAALKETQAALALSIPTNGRSEPAGKGGGSGDVKPSTSAFKR